MRAPSIRGTTLLPGNTKQLGRGSNSRSTFPIRPGYPPCPKASKVFYKWRYPRRSHEHKALPREQNSPHPSENLCYTQRAREWSVVEGCALFLLSYFWCAKLFQGYMIPVDWFGQGQPARIADLIARYCPRLRVLTSACPTNPWAKNWTRKLSSRPRRVNPSDFPKHLIDKKRKPEVARIGSISMTVRRLSRPQRVTL